MSRILCLNNGYPTDANPQYTTYVQTIVECLRKAGHIVDPLVILYTKPISPTYKLWKYLTYWWKTLFVRFDRYDIAYINHLPYAWPAVLNKRLYKTKVYVHWHGEELVSHSWFIRHVLKFLQPRIRDFKHIVPSNYFKQRLVEILGVSPNLINVSPSGGVDTAVFRPISSMERDNGGFVVGFSSALTTGKGADVLLALVRKQEEIERMTGHQVTFKVINYGREAGYYTEQLRQTGSRVEIVDKMPKDQMPLFYNSISLLLMVSVRESLGLVALEAMSCDRPVITYDLCAFPEFIVAGLSGELVHYTDQMEDRVKSIKEAMVKVIANYDRYRPREVVIERYSKESVVEYYKTL